MRPPLLWPVFIDRVGVQSRDVHVIQNGRHEQLQPRLQHSGHVALSVAVACTQTRYHADRGLPGTKARCRRC